MALSPAAAAKIADLLAKFGKFNAGLDLEEETRRRNASTALALLDEGLPKAYVTGERGLADRGLLQSGIGLGVRDTIRQNYLTNYGQTEQDRDTALSDIARRRLENQGTFDYERANIEREDTYGQPIVSPPKPAVPKVTPKKTPPKKPANATPSAPTTPKKPPKITRPVANSKVVARS